MISSGRHHARIASLSERHVERAFHVYNLGIIPHDVTLSSGKLTTDL